MGGYSTVDPTSSSFDLFGDDESNDQQRALAAVISPRSAAALVGPPPDVAPQTQPGQGTPRTGNLAAAPQQDVAKNLDTAAGRSAYNVQPAQPIGGVAPAVRPTAQPSVAPALSTASSVPQASMAALNPDPNASLRPGGTNPMPVVPAAAPTQVNAPPSQLSQDQARLAALTGQKVGGAGIQNPVGRGIVRGLDIAGSVLTPGIAQWIPHSTLNQQREIGQVQGRIGAETQQADVASQAAERNAKIQQDIANAGKADRFDPNSAKTVNTADGVFQLNPDTGKYDIRVGASPDKLQEGERPLGSTIPNLNKTLQDRYNVMHPGQPLPAQYVLPPTATQKDYDRVDKALGSVESAGATEAQRQQTNALKQQAMAATAAARDAAGNAGLDRETARMAKPYEKANDTASAQLDKIDDARNMISGNAEAQALGIPKVLTALVGGQGTGVRITTPELNAIATARGWTGDLQGTLNSISGKGKLTSTQQGQLKQILDDVKTRITQKRQIANDALDKINDASGRDDVIAADKEARQRLTDLESGKAPQTSTKSGGFDWSAHPKVNP